MLHKRVAIKEFFVKDFCNRDEQTSYVTVGTQTKVALVSKLRKKFVDEAIALSQLRHNNIVSVSDVFEENGTAYYVMDFVNGKSIHELLKQRKSLPEATAIKYIRQVAEALRYVHSQNRLHLDIKPGNILIDESDNAILIDFGASKQYDEESGENTSTLLGKTPGYAPIEQMGNSVQTFTPATDIYALGATLYKMLTGITPPESNLLVSDDEALQPLPHNISASTRNAVMQAMQVKRKDRPQSVDAFLGIMNIASDSSSQTIKDDDEETLIDLPDGTGSSKASDSPKENVGSHQIQNKREQIKRLEQNELYKDAYNLCIENIDNGIDEEYSRNKADELVVKLRKQTSKDNKKSTVIAIVLGIVCFIIYVIIRFYVALN